MASPANAHAFNLSDALRCKAHESGFRRLANLSEQRNFTSNLIPIYLGALGVQPFGHPYITPALLPRVVLSRSDKFVRNKSVTSHQNTTGMTNA